MGEIWVRQVVRPVHPPTVVKNDTNPSPGMAQDTSGGFRFLNPGDTGKFLPVSGVIPVSHLVYFSGTVTPAGIQVVSAPTHCGSG